jgi:polygalacturonase
MLLVCLAANITFAGEFSIAEPVSSAAVPTPANSTASGDKERQMFNTKDYGAAGDGITDDTAAFASVVAAATAARGTVQIPIGTYLASISVSKGRITIQGAGKDAKANV